MRRIWSEFVPYDELCATGTLRLLSERGLQLLVAATPSTAGGLPQVIERCREEKVAVGVWPMLHDSEGRWASALTARAFADYCREIEREIPAGGTWVFDIEPPLAVTRSVMQGSGSRIRDFFASQHRQEGEMLLRELALDLEEKGWNTLAALPPMVLGDKKGNQGWQWLLGTPAARLPFATLSAMCYSTLFEGYSRGLFERKHSRELLYACAEMAARRWGNRASISIGCTGIGAIGDEKAYRNVQELTEDVSLVRAAGVEDIALFDLGGVLAQTNPEAWLDAFVGTPAAAQAPKRSKRSRLTMQTISGGSQLLHLAHRVLGEKPGT